MRLHAAAMRCILPVTSHAVLCAASGMQWHVNSCNTAAVVRVIRCLAFGCDTAKSSSAFSYNFGSAEGGVV